MEKVIDASEWLERKLQTYYCIKPARDADFRTLATIYRTLRAPTPTRGKPAGSIKACPWKADHTI